ncbi:MAG: tetratricopeptide repeat protein, partial [Acidobacteriota bacterium]
FALAAKDEDLPGDTWRVREIQPLLQEFYIKAGISKLWEEHRSRYTAELAGYVPVLRRAIRSSLDYFRVPLRVMMDRRIILIPDLLNAHDTVNARNLERLYYIVVGPTDRPSDNFNQLHHEYLHSLVDPLVAKYGAVLLEHDKMLNMAQAQPHIRSDIQNSYILVVTESFIEALQLRMRKPSTAEAEGRLVRLVREGLIFAPLFYRQLEEYEKNEMIGLPAYIELIFKKVDKSTVDKDLEAIDRLESQIAEKRRQAQEAIDQHNREALQHNRRVALLRQAGQLMSAQKYPEAEAKLKELLEEDPGNGNASFYMAQILAQTGRHDDSFQWYKRSAESGADPQVRAWSWLRMGRIAAAGQRFQEARGYFEKVLTLEGELNGADRQARDLLGQLPPP